VRGHGGYVKWEPCLDADLGPDVRALGLAVFFYHGGKTLLRNNRGVRCGMLSLTELSSGLRPAPRAAREWATKLHERGLATSLATKLHRSEVLTLELPNEATCRTLKAPSQFTLTKPSGGFLHTAFGREGAGSSTIFFNNAYSLHMFGQTVLAVSYSLASPLTYFASLCPPYIQIHCFLRPPSSHRSVCLLEC
jgi:hypothetical protein